MQMLYNESVFGMSEEQQRDLCGCNTLYIELVMLDNVGEINEGLITQGLQTGVNFSCFMLCKMSSKRKI